MWFALSMCSVAAWAGSDVFSKHGTTVNKANNHLRIIIMVGFAMGLYAVGSIILMDIDYSLGSIITYLPVSLMYILSMTLGYIGLRYIALSITSPICNSSGALTALLLFFFRGQRMDSIQFVAVAVISLGILLLSIIDIRQSRSLDRGEGIKLRSGLIALIFPIMYCVIDGVAMFTDEYFLEYIVSEEEANISYMLTFFIAALISLSYLLFIKKVKLNIKEQGWFGLGAICETLGQFTYVYAISANAIIAAPLISSYSVMSAILSHIFLKERLKKNQYPAIALVILGIVILSIYEA